MKCTCPTQTQPLRSQRKLYSTGSCWGFCWVLLAGVGHYRLALGGRVGSSRVFGYQHVGIGNANPSRWGSYPSLRPNVSGFALQWNILKDRPETQADINCSRTNVPQAPACPLRGFVCPLCDGLLSAGA